MDLLARAADYIHTTWGVEVHIPAQGPNSGPVPDGTFEKDGIACNLEVECSTLATKKAQVAKNLRKAMEEKRRFLGVVRSMELADRLVQVARELVPEAKLGRELAVLAWGETRFSVVPRGISSDGFPFVPELPGGVGGGSGASPGTPGDTGTTTAPGEATNRGSDLEVAREAVTALRGRRNLRVTGDEVMDAMPEGERARFVSAKTGRITPKLGSVLARLGITWEKEWVKEAGNAVRLYDLRVPSGQVGESLVAREKETSPVED